MNPTPQLDDVVHQLFPNSTLCSNPGLTEPSLWDEENTIQVFPSLRELLRFRIVVWGPCKQRGHEREHRRHGETEEDSIVTPQQIVA